MSNQREWSLHNFLSEVRELKERMEKAFPSYLASLEKTSQLPGEFERRWWSAHVEALLQKVKADYQNYQAQAQKVDFLRRLMTATIDIALKAGGKDPIPLLPPIRVGISISPSGKIEPALWDDPSRQPDVIVITFEEFEAIARRVKGEILKGTIMPKSEEEMPKLVRDLALEHK